MPLFIDLPTRAKSLADILVKELSLLNIHPTPPPANMPSTPTYEPIIASNPKLQSYYSSLESSLDYRLLLGGTRHFGYYKNGADSPFPISRALRRM